MTKLRISDHCLEIEKGRHQRPYKLSQDRICPKCNIETEDEKHFLIKCKFYDNQRHKLFQEIQEQTNINLDYLPEQTKFTTLINPPIKLQNMVAKYIRECFQMRENSLRNE